MRVEQQLAAAEDEERSEAERLDGELRVVELVASTVDPEIVAVLETIGVKIRRWNEYYNDLEHCALDGRTPNEVLYS